MCILFSVTGANATEHDTLEFELKVVCTRDKNLKNKTVDPTDSFINDKGKELCKHT